MIKPEQIPDEVVDAFYASLARDECDRKAIAAALNAWPMSHIHEYSHGKISGVDIVLPLKQEDSND